MKAVAKGWREGSVVRDKMGRVLGPLLKAELDYRKL